jgi:signal transduction histidine kinase
LKGDQIVVQIRDNGAGMTEETKKRIFEPFYTTKAKGTGLGLAITYKILQAHKAQISVQSKPQQGTEFEITFPVA